MWNILISLLVFLVLGSSLGALLGWAAKVFAVQGDPRVDEITDLLPGGQCGQCGEAGCKQAAEAMVAGRLTAECCPPGGRALAHSIAKILGVSLGESKDTGPLVAYIDESQCSGCTRCFKACPFDAIIGTNKQMHTVIASVCTGCGLCEKACPQDCLSMIPVSSSATSWQWPNPRVA
ncbi:RnfABCDGE type electron transport complex subunit B [Echinimonas agarilytica]|uniref:Ion-translocating oxidoreductase complex subunit B n=1 Tax=Echinimonas agarilytica TaxID=1215918 RepID=A0AA42B8E8_9GAMM|nr:RnfABCDGE type electron transport complex subunit B [Echinimonas agarilytica]MCM2680453.1 RnfABCDGE type electron transport complex subunit B [Echinimonas agarilytica]